MMMTTSPSVCLTMPESCGSCGRRGEISGNDSMRHTCGRTLASKETLTEGEGYVPFGFFRNRVLPTRRKNPRPSK